MVSESMNGLVSAYPLAFLIPSSEAYLQVWTAGRPSPPLISPGGVPILPLNNHPHSRRLKKSHCTKKDPAVCAEFAVIYVHKEDHRVCISNIWYWNLSAWRGGHFYGSSNWTAPMISPLSKKYKYTPKVIFYCSVSNGQGLRCAICHGFFPRRLSPNSTVLPHQIFAFLSVKIEQPKTSARMDDIWVQVSNLKNLVGMKNGMEWRRLPTFCIDAGACYVA